MSPRQEDLERTCACTPVWLIQEQEEHLDDCRDSYRCSTLVSTLEVTSCLSRPPATPVHVHVHVLICTVLLQKVGGRGRGSIPTETSLAAAEIFDAWGGNQAEPKKLGDGGRRRGDER